MTDIKTKSVLDGINGWMVSFYNQSRETYFMNFMFRELNTSPKRTAEIMEQTIEKFYQSGRSQFSRRLRQDELPVLIGMPDLPVPKHGKQAVTHAVNGGFHFNGLLFVPDKCRARVGQIGTLLQNLLAKFRQAGNYLIERLHTTPVTHDPERIADYATKLAKRNGEMLNNHLLVLPKASSE